MKKRNKTQEILREALSTWCTKLVLSFSYGAAWGIGAYVILKLLWSN